jgi:signal transduction histidine kinase/CheY-like chemotaxis protein
MRLPTFPRGVFRWMSSSRLGIWLAICGLAAACLAVICVGGLIGGRADLRRSADASASATAEIAAHDIARAIDRLDLAIQTTVERLRSPDIMSLQEPARSMLLFDRASGLQSVGFISVLDESGTVTQSTQPVQLGTRWAGRDYFKAHREDPSLGLFIGRPFGQDDFTSVPLSRGISRQDGTFGGVVVASLKLSYIRELFSHLATGVGGSIDLLLDNGVVLMRLPFDRDAIGRSLTPEQAADAGHRTAMRQLGNVPLSVLVSVDPIEMVGQTQDWLAAISGAGLLVAGLGAATTLLLRCEVQRREAAERESRAKPDYLAMATHELRTPLHSILGNADRLRAEAAMDAVNSRRLGAIASAGHHLRGVVDRVLNDLRIESRLPTPHMSPIDINELLEQCCILVESDTAAKGLGLRYGFKAGAPEQFVTDCNLLRQILLNLLSNAVKFTERGQVTVEVGGTAERIIIEVRDSGCGIQPDQRHKLFQQGERLGAEKTTVPGHGNGLAMAQRLVRCLGGEIGFRENPPSGSIFWLGLPRGILPEPAARHPACGGVLSEPLNILLVEDVASHREIGRAFLLDAGHLVSDAQTGDKAVRLSAENDFDVVLMNLGLPGIDGFEAMRRIRAIPGARGQVTIIGMTASVPDQQLLEALQAGMAGYLVKPFTSAELLATLDRVAHARRSVAPVFDPDTLAQMAGRTNLKDMERQLLDLACRLEWLVGELQPPRLGLPADKLAEVVRDVAHTADRLGFAALAEAARGFDAPDEAASTRLLAAMRAALVELRELTSADPVGTG